MITIRKLNKLCIPCLGALLLVLTLGATRASADTIITITTGNSTLSGFTGPYATATVHLVDATHATITFNSLTNGIGQLFLLAGNSAVNVNVNASSWTWAFVSAANTSGNGNGVGAVSDGGPGTVDGFGVFNQQVNVFDGFTSGATQIVFTLTNLSGTWGSSAAVLTPNASGETAAIHGFVCSAANCPSILATGYGANGNPVPEPASIALFGSGLVALAGFIRRRRKQISAS